MFVSYRSSKKRSAGSAVVVLCSLCFQSQSTAEAAEQDAVSRSDLRAVCGVNALYMFLRLHDADVSYDALAAELRINPKGHSLADLKRVSAVFHCPSKVYRGDIAAIPDQSLPVILYIQDGNVDGSGHFLIMIAKSDIAAECLDGTTGKSERLKIEWLQSHTQGLYMALVSVQSGPRYATILAMATFMSIPPLVYCFLRLGFKPAIARITSFRVCSVLGVQLLLLSGLAQVEIATANSVLDRSDVEFCRRPEFSAENAAYLFLRICGQDPSYRDVHNRLCINADSPNHSVSMLSMNHLFSEYNVKTRLLRCPPQMFFDKCIPAVTLLRETRGEADEFVLVVGSDTRRVAIIHCGYVTLEFIDRDEFLRSWSGIALSSEPRKSIPLSLALGVCGTAGIGAFLLWWRIA